MSETKRSKKKMTHQVKPKVSVILTAHNYAKFIEQAIESVLNQSFQKYELIIINDGSTDHTNEILNQYNKHPKIKIIHLDGVGLASACNRGIKESSGTYVIRLDADDYFDENMLLIESNILDTMPNVQLVYSDYYQVDYSGSIIDHYRLMKSNDEIKLLDRAPLGAGAMYRRECHTEIGGYNEKLRFQEDYDFWLKFINRYNVYNVGLPLMYYRRHEGTMSTNTESRLMARRYVKHNFVKKEVKKDKIKIIGLVAASLFIKKDISLKLPLSKIKDHPLIHYPLKALKECEYIESFYVSTDDIEIENTVKKYGALSLGRHPKELAKPGVLREEIVKYFLKKIGSSGLEIPDIIVTLSPNYPAIKEFHVREAIDTMLIHNYDSVISVIKHYDFYWKPGPYGIMPFGYNRKMMKEDHEGIYLETGGIKVIKTKNLLGDNWLGSSVGFIELMPKETIAIEDSEFSIWLASQMIEKGYWDKIPEKNFLYKGEKK